MPTVLVKSWGVNATLFDGDVAAGVVPTLFSADPEASRSAINKDVYKAHYDINRLNKAFFMAENVTGREAINIIKKARDAVVNYAYRRQKLMPGNTSIDRTNPEGQPQQKRARTEDTETGK